jgi:hypothetical protein
VRSSSTAIEQWLDEPLGHRSETNGNADHEHTRSAAESSA